MISFAEKWKPETRKKASHYGRQIVENAVRFAFNLLFVNVFGMFFGSENLLYSVAIGVAFTMFPTAPVGVNIKTMAGMIMFFTVGCGIMGQTALLPIWIAVFLDFLFVAAILLTMSEPLEIRPAISFLLAFVFSQATPVPWELFPKRLVCGIVGGALTAAATVSAWKRLGMGLPESCRTFRRQIGICAKNRAYILRMSAGIAVAMGLGMALQLKKPLWISIVVMSLTQPDFHGTFERIKGRVVGTLVGIAVFVVVLQILIPREYAMILILLIGYFNFFMSEYKHKQAVNAVCALNASLVLLDTGTAIRSRVLCLILGIGIVVALCLIQVADRIWVEKRGMRSLES